MMKKFVRILCFALVAVMLCAALASCAGSPADNPEDAAKALEENGYKVTKTDNVVVAEKDGEYISITYCADEDTATKMYEEAEKAKEEAEAKLEEAEEKLEAAKDEIADMEDGLEKTAKEAGLKILEEAVKAAQKAAEAEIGQSGEMFWIGTEQAIKDAK